MLLVAFTFKIKQKSFVHYHLFHILKKVFQKNNKTIFSKLSVKLFEKSEGKYKWGFYSKTFEGIYGISF